MRFIIFKSMIMVASLAALLAFDTPTGWYKAGTDPSKYEMGIDKGACEKGMNAASIKSINKDIAGFGTLMQNCLPDKYLGKRIKMTGRLRSNNVDRWAGLWLRVDGKRSSHPLSFDNMHDRPIKGTTNWQTCSIVVDVPASSSNIAYGALLDGTGQIWFTDLNIAIVDTSVPVTGTMTVATPTNMNFEK